LSWLVTGLLLLVAVRAGRGHSGPFRCRERLRRGRGECLPCVRAGADRSGVAEDPPYRRRAGGCRVSVEHHHVVVVSDEFECCRELIDRQTECIEVLVVDPTPPVCTEREADSLPCRMLGHAAWAVAQRAHVPPTVRQLRHDLAAMARSLLRQNLSSHPPTLRLTRAHPDRSDDRSHTLSHQFPWRR
jgi:hypothetical protein